MSHRHPLLSRTHRRLAWVGAALLSCLTISCGTHHDGQGSHVHPADEPPELEAQAVTVWTDRTELFMEHRPLVVGQEVSFAAHVTALPSFKPVTSGRVEIRLTMAGADGHTLVGHTDGPSSPGIFRPVLRPDRAGRGELSMVVSGQLQDTFSIGPCEVFADVASAATAMPDHGHGHGLPFLKEQQWNMDFATAPATVQGLQPSVQANGEIRPAAGKDVALTANVSGRISLADPVPEVGRMVKKGQLLATIAPLLSAGGDIAAIQAEVDTAAVELAAATADLVRVTRLAEQQSIASRRVEEATARVQTAQARVSGGERRLKQYSGGAAGKPSAGGSGDFHIRPPFDGVLVESRATSGAFVEAGSQLFRVIDLDKIWLEARVFEADIPRVTSSTSAWFTIAGHSDVFDIDQSNGRLVTVGRVIDPNNRTIPVIFEVANRGDFFVGQYAQVHIASGAVVWQVAIPESAALQDGNRVEAFVQVGGEEFERRQLKVGARSHGLIGVESGIQPGERVVTVGAYDIKLQAASGVIPAHGHAH